MNESSKSGKRILYSPSENYVSRNIMDQVILVPVGAASGDLNGFITFDGAAVDIWNKLSGAPSDLDELTRYLAEEYEQPDDIIRNDIIAFLEDAVAKGVVIEKTA